MEPIGHPCPCQWCCLEVGLWEKLSHGWWLLSSRQMVLLHHWVAFGALVPAKSQLPLFFWLFQIDYFNNQVIVDLVEQQHKGIIAILDDACMNVGKVTDEMFLEALNSKLGKHAHFSSRKVPFAAFCSTAMPFLLFR